MNGKTAQDKLDNRNKYFFGLAPLAATCFIAL